ncbi:MAG: hypothetical protein QM774_01895 [Gordonia sp. (in: high G+C Gram-positive bacteria)]|uniref:hypothetical protein n=1 Tax=Gordonia sp. (in: high G+C Gram-positive bacteria) TaxID=84139 RepID=UPI0039E3892F
MNRPGDTQSVLDTHALHTRGALVTRVLLLLAVLTALIAVLAACGEASDTKELHVASSGTPQMKAAAALYAVALTRAGTPATTDGAPTGDDARLLDAIAAGDIDLFPAFTGDVLTDLTPSPPALTGDELQAQVSRSLPQGVAIGDPTGAARTDPRGLGQDLVPVYRSAELDKPALAALSRIAGDLSTEDLDALGDRVAAGEDPRSVAADWLSTHASA